MDAPCIAVSPQFIDIDAQVLGGEPIVTITLRNEIVRVPFMMAPNTAREVIDNLFTKIGEAEELARGGGPKLVLPNG